MATGTGKTHTASVIIILEGQAEVNLFGRTAHPDWTTNHGQDFRPWRCHGQPSNNAKTIERADGSKIDPHTHNASEIGHKDGDNKRRINPLRDLPGPVPSQYRPRTSAKSCSRNSAPASLIWIVIDELPLRR
jgi:hypothetical protein